MLSIYYADYRNFDIIQPICDKNIVIMLKSKSVDALCIREYTLENMK